jgi:hypothetical protein
MAGIERLTIADNNYTGTAKKYTNESARIEGLYSKYLLILDSISTDEIILGERAEKMKNYADFTRQYLSGKLDGVISGQSRRMTSYIVDIDSADSLLY